MTTTRLVQRRAFTSSFGQSSPTNRTHLIFGANTDVGKTVLITGLAQASCNPRYIKPLQCGGSDQAFVERHCSHVEGKTLFSWDTPASPHVASISENLPVSDDEVLASLRSSLDVIPDDQPSTTWIETAGGVMSPSSASPQNSSLQHAVTDCQWGWQTQADLYRPMADQLSVVLVGDGRLGGISVTLTSLESLMRRGYNIQGLLLIESGYGNISALREHVSRQVESYPLFDNPNASIVSLPELPPESEPLHNWLDSLTVKETLAEFNEHLGNNWTRSFGTDTK